MALLLKDKSEMKTAKSLVSINPATLEVLGEIEITDREGVLRKVDKAKEAFKSWSKLSFKERSYYLLSAKDYIMANLEQICQLISRENGKPLVEAITAEVMPVLDLLDYFVKNSEDLLSNEKISLGRWALLNKSSYVEYLPLGVIGIISPWNFPFSIPMGEIIMALIAGNTVVLKPSEHTPLIGLEIENIFKKVGLPNGVFNIVTGFGETGANLVDSRVNKIIFTGSVATGKRIMAAAANNLTPVVLELGGKDR